ncbi:hypothetical protein ACJJTC_008381 [Scirpophaga incertulas]
MSTKNVENAGQNQFHTDQLLPPFFSAALYFRHTFLERRINLALTPAHLPEKRQQSVLYLLPTCVPRYRTQIANLKFITSMLPQQQHQQVNTREHCEDISFSTRQQIVRVRSLQRRGPAMSWHRLPRQQRLAQHQ